MLAHYYFDLLDGDILYLEEAQKLLQKYNLMDDDGFEMCEDDKKDGFIENGL